MTTILAVLCAIVAEVVGLVVCSVWQHGWMNGLGLLANVIQVLSGVGVFHIFMKVHKIHKHIQNGGSEK